MCHLFIGLYNICTKREYYRTNIMVPTKAQTFEFFLVKIRIVKEDHPKPQRPSPDYPVPVFVFTKS